jgi:hypothetical protein
MRIAGGIHENAKNARMTENIFMYKERCINYIE